MSCEVATHIELRKNRAGQDRAYVGGTRVRVQDVYALAEIQGMTPDEIVRQLPHITLGQVHAALSYYFDHREEIIRELREDEEFARLVRAHLGPGPLEARLGGLTASDAVSP
jgi:uncharacterized protein (DUF433 family)